MVALQTPLDVRRVFAAGFTWVIATYFGLPDTSGSTPQSLKNSHEKHATNMQARAIKIADKIFRAFILDSFLWYIRYVPAARRGFGIRAEGIDEPLVAENIHFPADASDGLPNLEQISRMKQVLTGRTHRSQNRKHVNFFYTRKIVHIKILNL